jgi:hypothetical protein
MASIHSRVCSAVSHERALTSGLAGGAAIASGGEEKRTGERSKSTTILFTGKKKLKPQ